ncbi:hypothetical protein ncot_10135 [Nocardioides sp. JQ2195]|uniref:SipW-dependent-type signal peptide-containing protein n=1 Tax=Nocardioides sp. JQ2195 TaxID=2592334 RepID=UPI00143E8135|nr:SipW-dependent-type signal peptide-containing protein [Nocardioides sp. JQ2195]QIX26922.1 hypothetical protein ncot_10135 [Nocardioides sp. JQ2195]
MGRHTETWPNTGRKSAWQVLRSARTRAVLSLGLLLGFGSIGTYAYWSDTAVVSGGPISSGTMDLQFDSNGAVGPGANYAKTTISWSGLVPGERKAFNLDVRNVGDPPLTYVATATQGASPAWSFVGTPITVQLFTGRAQPVAAYPQVDTCSGTSLAPAKNVDGTAKSLTDTAQQIAASGTQQVCVIVGLDLAATNANQGKTGSVALTFTASQKTS